MDEFSRLAVTLAMAVVMATGGCASVPPPPGARQVIEVTPHRGVAGFVAGALEVNTPVGRVNFPPIEAICTASNDRGSWTIAAPGRLDIVPSTAPLKVACRQEGYRESSIELRCVAPRTRGTARGAYLGLRIAGMTGAGAVVVLPAAGVILAATAGAAAVGGAAGAAVASGPDADVCTYAEDSTLHVWLAPLEP